MDYKRFKCKHANIVIEIISLLEKGVKKAQEILEKPTLGVTLVRKQQRGYAY